jgi:hypothetical protein
MSTGDEPQLGGRSDDNAPMIGSVQTRVIVSARGAYTVGNLDALVGLMDEDQQTLFKQTIIEEYFDRIERRVVDGINADGLQIPELLPAFIMARDWIYDPDPRVPGWLKEDLEHLDAIMIYEWYMYCNIKMVTMEAIAVPDYIIYCYPQMRDALTRWYLETALAILHDQPIPPLESL